MPKTNPETNAAKKLIPEFQAQHPTARLFRNNTGMAINKNGAPVYFGVGKPKKNKKTGHIYQTGGGDYIGWETIEITSDMVGEKIAVFLSVETKTSTGRLSQDQKEWSYLVEMSGGIVKILKGEG